MERTGCFPLRYTSKEDGDHFTISGNAPEHIEPNYRDAENPVRYGDSNTSKGLKFHGRLAVAHVGGTMRVDADGLHVIGATVATLYFSAATSFDPGIGASSPERDPEQWTALAILAICEKEYTDIRNRHVDDHGKLFGRVALHLGESKAPADMPTNRRIAEYGSSDPGLVELLFHYGRYLLMASSRPGTSPANLQGIWNEETRAPWSSNYTSAAHAAPPYCMFPQANNSFPRYSSVSGTSASFKLSNQIISCTNRQSYRR